MSKNKITEKSNRGGRRDGAGRPATGITKRSFSITVDNKIAEKALNKWGGKASPLVEKLMREYTGD